MRSQDKTPENKEESKKKLPKVWGKGPIKIGDIELDCYILDDGTAVLSKRKTMTAIGRKWKGDSRTDSPNFIGAKNLQPFIRPELLKEAQGIEFYDGGRIVSGFRADMLPLVCNVFLEARRVNKLTASQLPIAEKCEILVTAFARVGLVALIYEQLGYEKFKRPDALRLLVESYLAEEVRKWSKEFPDELFFQMDRIYGRATPTNSRNRPRYYAKFLRKYIYDPIEKGLVLEELDQRNPTNAKGHRAKKHHSLLNEEKGLPKLRSQIWQVVACLKTSPGRAQFDRAYARLMGYEKQAEFPFMDE